jgi:peptide/nickel transport system substrate-binding protein
MANQKSGRASRRRFLEVTAVTGVAGIAAACQAAQTAVPPTAVPATQAPATLPATPAPTKDPRFGGKFRVATQAVPPTLDAPGSLHSAVSCVTNGVFEQLVTFGEDFSVIPMLAEKWEISDDGKTYTFPLRKGIKFHNGKELTADDVEASIKRYMLMGARKSQLEAMIESYEVKDSYTFVMRLNKASAAFLGTLGTPAGDVSILPKEIADARGADPLNVPNDIIGTGPYQLAEYKADQHVRLKRFDGYQPLPGERNGMGGAKIAYFDEVEVVFVAEAGSRMAGLETGEYDWIEAVPETEVDNVNNNPDLKLMVVKPYAGAYILFNHEEKFSGDLKFRQAILAALDMDAVAMAGKTGHKELYDLNECIWPRESVWHFEDDFAKSLYNQNNPEEGKQLLAESGYNGEEIVLLTNNTGEFFRIGMQLAEQLKQKLGMNIRVEPLDSPSKYAKMKEKAGWHLETDGYATLELVNPNAGRGYWGCGVVTLGFFCNPKMEAALDQLDSATTTEQRKEYLKDLQRVFYEELPNIKLYQYYQSEATRSDIQGYKTFYRPRFFSVWREPKK